MTVFAKHCKWSMPVISSSHRDKTTASEKKVIGKGEEFGYNLGCTKTGKVKSECGRPERISC